jgi:steroid delta-isomerase-like uncharacterized protein
MSIEEDNMQIVHRFHEAINSGRLDDLDAFVEPDYIEHNGLGSEPGLGGTKAMVRHFKAAMPDFTLEIEGMVAEGDRVAVRGTIHATHTHGRFAGISATGKTMRYGGMEFIRIKNGKIVERWLIADIITLAQQVGLMPPRGGPAH